MQDLGSHLIDLVDYILQDKVVSVQASARCLENDKLVAFSERKNKEQAADSIYFNSVFQSGAHGVFQTSWINPQGKAGQTVSIELHGTRGTFRFQTSGYGYELTHCSLEKALEQITIPHLYAKSLSEEPSEDRFRPYRSSKKNEALKWADAILSYKYEGKCDFPDLPGFAQADYVQRVMDAVMSSEETKKNRSCFTLRGGKVSHD